MKLNLIKAYLLGIIIQIFHAGMMFAASPPEKDTKIEKHKKGHEPQRKSEIVLEHSEDSFFHQFKYALIGKLEWDINEAALGGKERAASGNHRGDYIASVVNFWIYQNKLANLITDQEIAGKNRKPRSSYVVNIHKICDVIREYLGVYFHTKSFVRTSLDGNSKDIARAKCVVRYEKRENASYSLYLVKTRTNGYFVEYRYRGVWYQLDYIQKVDGPDDTEYIFGKIPGRVFITESGKRELETIPDKVEDYACFLNLFKTPIFEGSEVVEYAINTYKECKVSSTARTYGEAVMSFWKYQITLGNIFTGADIAKLSENDRNMYFSEMKLACNFVGDYMSMKTTFRKSDIKENRGNAILGERCDVQSIKGDKSATFFLIKTKLESYFVCSGDKEKGEKFYALDYIELYGKDQKLENRKRVVGHLPMLSRNVDPDTLKIIGAECTERASVEAPRTDSPQEIHRHSDSQNGQKPTALNSAKFVETLSHCTRGTKLFFVSILLSTIIFLNVRS